MKRLIALAGLLLVFAAPAAFAAEGGLYLSLFGGGTAVQGAENDSDEGSFNFEYNPGWVAGASIGFDLRGNYPQIGIGRVELEAAWRENDLDKAEFSVGTMSAEGKVKAASLMLNTIGESRDLLPWLPYVGAGLGAARITMDKITTEGYPVVDDKDTVFAYQFLAGVAYQAAPRLFFDLGYRYFATTQPKFTDATGTGFDSQYVVHNVTLGMRLDF